MNKTITALDKNRKSYLPLYVFGDKNEIFTEKYNRIASVSYIDPNRTLANIAFFAIGKNISYKDWEHVNRELKRYDRVLVAVEDMSSFAELSQNIENHGKIRFVWNPYSEANLIPLLHNTLLCNEPEGKKGSTISDSVDVENILLSIKNEIAARYEYAYIGFCNSEFVVIQDPSGKNLVFSRKEGVIGALSYSILNIKLEPAISEELNRIFYIEHDTLYDVWHIVPLNSTVFVLVLINSTVQESDKIYYDMRMHVGILNLIASTFISHSLHLASLDPNCLYRQDVVKKFVRPISKFSDPIDINTSWALSGIVTIFFILLICIMLSFFISVPKYAPGYGVIQDSGVAKLISPETGIVQSIYYHPGDFVSRNTTLLRLLNQQILADRQSTLHELDDLKIKRLRNHFQTADSSRFDNLASKLKQLELLDDAYEVKAEDDGQLSEVYVKEGDLVQAGQKVMYLKVHASSNSLRFAISAHHLPDVNMGEIVSVRLPTLPNDILTAKVIKIQRQALSKRGALQALDIEELNIPDTSGSYILLTAEFFIKPKQQISQYLINGYQGPVILQLKNVPLIARLIPSIEKLHKW